MPRSRRDDRDTWTAGRPVVSRLDAFYRTIADTARAGLRAPLSDAASYRPTATAMLAVLRGLASVDTESRAFAATVGLELPPVVGSVPAATATPDATRGPAPAIDPEATTVP